MEKKRKQAVLIAALIMVICTLLGVFLIFSPKRENSAQAELVIDSSNKATYLNISGTTLSGFKSGMSPTEPFSLVIPKEVVTISAGAFRGTNIVSVSYETGRTTAYLTIGGNGAGDSGVFENCTLLQSVSLPSSADTNYRVGSNTFKNCTSLTEISIPAGATTVWNGTYQGCISLERVSFEGTTNRQIRANAFNGCTMLNTIDTRRVTRVDASAFNGCRMLTNINLTAVTQNVGASAFSGCERLVDVGKPATESYITANDTGIYLNVLNSYTSTSGGTRIVKLRNYVFCQKTATPGTSNYLASSGNNNEGTNSNQNVATGWAVSYTNNNWYLVSYEGGLNDRGYDDSQPMDFPTAAELQAAASSQLGLGGSASSYEYDINQWAFHYVHAHIVEIPSFVEVIGNSAFNSCALRVLDLSGASKLTKIGYQAFYADGGSVVYMPDRRNLDNQSAGDVIWLGTAVSSGSGVPALIIAPNYNAYSALIESKHSYWGAFTDVLTYLVPINLHYATASGGTAGDKYDTEYRLWKKTYNYVEQEGSRLWSYDIEKNLPVQKGYSYSVWYSSADYNGANRITESDLNSLLSNNFLYGSSVDLYAHVEKKPGDVLPSKECLIELTKYTYDGVSYGLGVSDINRLLFDRGSSAELTDIMEARIVEYVNSVGAANSSPETLDSIRNAGKYTISVQLKSDYGAWANPATITVNIAQKEIDLSLVDNHKFQLDDGRNLRNGILYFDEGSDIPYQEQFDASGNERNALSVENSYVRNNNAEQKIELMELLGAKEGGRAVYSVSGTNSPITKIPNEPGSYSTVFNLSLIYDEGGVRYDYSNNYAFVDNGSSTESDLSERGVQIITANYSATIIKVWYIVEVDNYFTKYDTTDSDSYSVESWTYGLGNPTMPYINYGGADHIKFTLRYTSAANGFDREAVTPGINEATATAYSEFATYVNSSMPVGRYELGLYYPEVWTHNANGTYVYVEPSSDIINDYTKHFDCYTIYSFDVTAAPLDDSRVADEVNAIKNKLNKDTTTLEFDYDGNLHFLDDESRTAVEALTNLNVTKKPDGVWKDSKYAKCFGGFQITYNLERTQSNQYFPEGEFTGVSPTDPDVYKVYYQLSAPNWQSLVNPNTDDVTDPAYRRNYYYTVIITKLVAAPTVTDVTYTGERVAPFINYSDTNAVTTVEWSEDDEYINGGEHNVKFTLSDYPYYYFIVKDASGNNVRSKEVTVTFTISAVTNNWALTPVINGWTFGDTPNKVDSGVYYGTVTYKYYAGTPNGTQGNYSVPDNATPYDSFDDLLAANKTGGNLNAGSYYIWAYVTGNADYTGLSHVTTFTVSKSSVSVPSIPAATYNGSAHNLSVANTEYYTASSASAVIYAGTYYIDVTLRDSTNYQWLKDTTVISTPETKVEFIVNTAQNSWVQSPSAISWQWSQFDRTVNLFSAQPTYWQKTETVRNAEQSITWYIYEYNNGYVKVDKQKDGHNLKDGFILEQVNGEWVVPQWVADLLNEFDAGKWYLRAEVSQGYNENNNTDKTNYDFYGLGGDSTTPIPFVILVASNNWKVSPGVRGWLYNGYVDGTSITAAQPAYGSAKYTVTVAADSGNKPVNPDLSNLSNFASLSDTKIVAALKALPAGDYVLTVSVDAVANKYNSFSMPYGFTVGKAVNNVQLAINSWIYNQTPVLSVNYPSKSENAGVQFTLTYPDGTEPKTKTFTLQSDLEDELKLLGASNQSYELKVDVTASNNYAAGYASTTFTVQFATNTWANGPKLTINNNEVTRWDYNPNIWKAETPTTERVVAVYAASVTTNASYSVSYYRAETDANGNYQMGTTPIEAPTVVGYYFMVVTCSGVANYSDLTGALFFQITKGTNEFATDPAVTGDPDNAGKIVYNGIINWTAPTSLYNLGDKSIVVTVDGTAVTGSVIDKLNSLGAGAHTVVVTLPETDNFYSVTETINFSVEKADFTWTAPSVAHGAGVPDSVAYGWLWGSYVENGSINLGSASNVDNEAVTFNYVISDAKGNTYLLASMATANVGKYSITVIATANGNYNDKTATIDFEIVKADNSWTSTPGGNGPYYWDYGNAVNVDRFGTATPRFGTNVSITYKTQDGSATYNDTPTGVGSYYIVYTVAGTDNYNVLIKEVPFEINGAVVDTWSIGFGVSSYWEWNNYDKDTHVFRGVPTSGGKVTYAILSGTNELLRFTLDNNGKVSDYVETELNKLEAGNYTLKVYVSANLGYEAFEADTNLSISVADNAWTVSPTIAPWVVGEWQDTLDNSVGNVPQGLAKYGEVEFIITDAVNADGEVTGDEFYKATLKVEVRTDGTSETIFSEIKNLFRNSLDKDLAGRYFLVASVKAQEKQYDGISEVVQFQVFSSSVEIPSNYWIIIPAIDNWTAGDKPSTPRAAPLRDENKSLSFTYYVMNFNSETNDYEQGDKIVFNDIVNAGRYRMVVEVYGYDPTNRDYMKAEIDFNVDKRINNWAISPSIENWFLSETPSVPVYETTQDSIVTITYKRTDVANSPVLTQRPTEAGDYVMMVTAEAPHCDDLTVEFEFKVMLSTNTWEKIPSLENWSEEFDPNNPEAKAAFGDVVYEYFTEDGEKLKEKPTTEGNYIMRATVEAYGYAPLVEEVEFTIEPAFDMTFILIDTALGVVAVILSIVLISVIIRRRNK